MQDPTLIAVAAVVITLVVHSVLLGRWGGMLTQKVKQTENEIGKLAEAQRKHEESEREARKQHEERLRMVETAVVRFEALAERLTTHGGSG